MSELAWATWWSAVALLLAGCGHNTAGNEPKTTVDTPSLAAFGDLGGALHDGGGDQHK